MRPKGSMMPVIALFDKAALRGRPLYGSISQVDLGDRIRAEFMMDNLESMARWLLMFGTAVEVESPAELNDAIAAVVDELREHYAQRNLIS